MIRTGFRLHHRIVIGSNRESQGIVLLIVQGSIFAQAILESSVLAGGTAAECAMP